MTEPERGPYRSGALVARAMFQDELRRSAERLRLDRSSGLHALVQDQLHQIDQIGEGGTTR